VATSVSVAPKLTLFGGSFLNLSFGGGGKRGRGRGKGGLLRRAAGFLGMGVRQLTGKGSGPKPAGKPAGRSFDQFRDSRPDLFEDQGDELERVELGDDEQCEDEDLYRPGGAS